MQGCVPVCRWRGPPYPPHPSLLPGNAHGEDATPTHPPQHGAGCLEETLWMPEGRGGQPQGHIAVATTSEVFVTCQVSSHFYYLPLTGGKLRCKSRHGGVGNRAETCVRAVGSQDIPLIPQGEGVASKGWSDANLRAPHIQIHKPGAKGIRHLSPGLGCLPQERASDGGSSWVWGQLFRIPALPALF